MNYTLTKQGLNKIESYIAGLKAKRTEILNACLDTCDDTPLPDVESIAEDCVYHGFDHEGISWNVWGVTDNTNYDPISLKVGEDILTEDFPYVIPQELLDELENSGFHIAYCDNSFEISIDLDYSNYDGSVNVYVGNSLKDLENDAYEQYDSYDVSAEAYLWLDDSGHGKNGAPYDMRDVYNDLENYSNRIFDLYEIIHNFNIRNNH